jgi:hypothetical protein
MHEWQENINLIWGTRWRSWLRHCSASEKVAVSIPYGVTGIVHSRNPYDRTTFLESTQTLTKINASGIS